MTIRLRGHHLLCLLTYAGRGYSPEFIADFDDIVRRLAAGEGAELCEGPDDICAPLCGKDAEHCTLPRVNKRDRLALRQIGELLGRALEIGEQIVLSAPIIAKLREAFAQGKIRAACKGCEWHDFCTEIAQNSFKSAQLS